jgi:hypothetical protein
MAKDEMDKRAATQSGLIEPELQWLQENRAVLAAYNARVAEHGLLSDCAGLLDFEVDRA